MIFVIVAVIYLKTDLFMLRDSIAISIHLNRKEIGLIHSVMESYLTAFSSWLTIPL